MADVQIENGYIKIANELFEAFARIRISGEARQVLDVIIRKTYGYSKKEDRISLSQFCLATGMSKIGVCKALNKLQEMNLITKKGNDLGIIYKLNKDFDNWKPLPKKVTITNIGNNHYQKRKSSLPKKRNTIDILTKDNKYIDEKVIKEPPNPDVKLFMDYAFETYKAKTGSNLLIDYGKEGKITKTLLQTFKLDSLKALWDKLLADENPSKYVLENGYSITIFKFQINRYTSQEARN